jgi:hypothetical protein
VISDEVSTGLLSSARVLRVTVAEWTDRLPIIGRSPLVPVCPSVSAATIR